MTHEGGGLSHNQKVMARMTVSVQLWISLQSTSLPCAACDSAVVVNRHMWHCALTPASVLLHMKKVIAEGHCSRLRSCLTCDSSPLSLKIHAGCTDQEPSDEIEHFRTELESILAIATKLQQQQQ